MIHSYNTGCNQFLSEYNGPLIDAVVTSPPYHKKHGFSIELIQQLAQLLFFKMHISGVIFLNFGLYQRDPMRPFKVAETFVKSGFILQNTIAWIKSLDGVGQFTPITSKLYLNDMWEYIFVFTKNQERELDRLSIGIEYKDKNNIKRFSGNKVRCAGNVWFIPHDSISRNHWAHDFQFPAELPRRALKLAKLKPDDIVFDPFAGSGIVGLVAEKLGYNAILTEKDTEKFNKSLIQNPELSRQLH